MDKACPGLLNELRSHQRDFPSLIHGPLCGRAADELDRLRADNARLTTALEKAAPIVELNCEWDLVTEIHIALGRGDEQSPGEAKE